MERATRDRDIDYIKGVACLMMIMGHTGFYLGYSAQLPPSWKTLWIIAECSVALFFMATGMNVLHYVNHNESRRGFGPTQTYFIANLALFIGGLAYNLNRQTFGLMDLFQGIAAAAFLTYIPFRRKWPTWAIVIIAVECFGIAFGAAMTPDMSIQHGYIRMSAREFIDSGLPHSAHPGLFGKYLATLAEIRALPLWERFFRVHFAVLPWTGCALLGGAIMRHAKKDRVEAFLWVFFAACILLSLYFPFFKGRNAVDFFFRGKADYVFRHVGIGGLLILAARRWYAGRTSVGRWVEFIGRESLIVFVLQWPFIELTAPYIAPKEAGMITVMPTSFAIIAAVTLLAWLLAKWRDRGVDKRSYFFTWFALSIFFSGVTAFFHYSFHWRFNVHVHVAHLFSFPAAICFAMALPALKTVVGGRRQQRPAEARA
jgi:surface polysaccharide O-acyltransferase-like enzyme